jgi:hypothetical protein
MKATKIFAPAAMKKIAAVCTQVSLTDIQRPSSVRVRWAKPIRIAALTQIAAASVAVKMPP